MSTEHGSDSSRFQIKYVLTYSKLSDTVNLRAFTLAFHSNRMQTVAWYTVGKRSWYEPAHTQTAIEYKWHQVIELQHQQWKRNKASLSRNHHSAQTHTQTHIGHIRISRQPLQFHHTCPQTIDKMRQYR